MVCLDHLQTKSLVSSFIQFCLRSGSIIFKQLYLWKKYAQSSNVPKTLLNWKKAFKYTGPFPWTNCREWLKTGETERHPKQFQLTWSQGHLSVCLMLLMHCFDGLLCFCLSWPGCTCKRDFLFISFCLSWLKIWSDEAKIELKIGDYMLNRL